MSKKLIGICRICGELKELSEEHIPPKSAFNDQMIIYESMADAFGKSGRRYSKSPNGIKRKSLCKVCNNLTGGWYAPEFVIWAKQGYQWLHKLQNPNLLQLPFYIKPLNIIKQIITMIIALKDEDYIPHYAYLRRFILNQEHKYLPPDIKIYSYFTRTTKPRLSNLEGVISHVKFNTTDYVHAEIALPPFGYVVTSTKTKNSKSLAVQQGLYDITWFSRFDYNIWIQAFLKLPLKETNTPFPLDYRTKDEISSGK